MAYIKIWIFLAVLALANTQKTSVENYYGDNMHAVVRNDEYIDAHRRHYAGNIWYYDFQINKFKEAYLERVNSFEYQKEALVRELIRVDEHLYPLTVLSDFSKACVQKYKSLIPSMAWAKSEMDRCISVASNQANSLITYMSSTNRTLQSHYATTFEKELNACKTKFNTTSPTNYTICLANAVALTNTYTLNNQKSFSSQLQTAKNSVAVHMKTVQECTFGVYNTTVSRISEANSRIDTCLRGNDDCSHCSGFYCQEVFSMHHSLIDPQNATMFNPFYRREAGKCLMMNIV
uniref:Protein TsetseEP domain-containing protein n=1 Tax=Stomoxys calcitrans TaxID=35570 RepID=A0A1I8PR27_STOCA